MTEVTFQYSKNANMNIESTAFQDGTIYLITNTGKLYIDKEVDNQQYRILVNPDNEGGSSSLSLDIILSASSWVDNSQIIANTNIHSSSNGILGLSQSAEVNQVIATNDAILQITGQSEGSITVTAYGIVPTIDISCTLLIL